MSNLAVNYDDEIFNEFKLRFNSYIQKNIAINYEKLLQETLFFFEIKRHQKNDFTSFENWFYNIYEFKFLKEIIKNTQFNELIFHDEKHIQVKSINKDLNLVIDEINEIDFELSLEILSQKNNQNWNYSNPFVSFYYSIANIPLRISILHKSVSQNKKSKLFIRKHSQEKLPLDLFFNDTVFKDELISLVQNKSNILIVGGTGSGKTSLLQSLLEFTNLNDHTVIIEDTHEIKIDRFNITNLVSEEGLNGKSMNDYCKYAMRISPDRLILGEMRSNEVVPFMLSMNSGHKGLMSTIHANSAYDSISRLALLFSIYSGGIDLNTEFITDLICKNLDYIIFIKDKKIHEIVRVLGSDRHSPIIEQVYLNLNH